MKPFLILQLRPNKAGDYEYKAFMKYGGLTEEDTHRIEMTRESIPEIDFADYSGIIVGGGGACVSDKEKPNEQIRFENELGQILDRVIEHDFPFLGACYGIGALAAHLGGTVAKECSEDVAALDITLTEEGKNDPLLKGVSPTFRAFAGHKESCIRMPDMAILLASSKKCPVHMMRIKKNVYATQFHPELDVENLIIRIQVYKNDGYFPPEDAEKLILAAQKEVVTEPMKIMKNFVELYKRS